MCFKKRKKGCNVHDNQINRSFKDITKKELAIFLVLNNKSHTHANWKKKNKTIFLELYVLST